MPATDVLPGKRLSLADVEREAATVLDPVHADFFAGAAGDESTARANLAAFERIRLRPRVLRDVSARSLATSLLGRPNSMPVLLSPTAFHRLAHPAGEPATARAAEAAGVTMVVSMAATTRLEEVAAHTTRPWLQLYLQPDQDFTRHLVRRAGRAGYGALVVTVDSPVFGRRERDHRNGFHDLPGGLRCENLVDDAGVLRDIVMDAGLTWDAVARLRETTDLPILLKGVLHPDDARLAVEHGVDGLFVSNHGGRQLDGAIATADALPGVAAVVPQGFPLIVDGGVRRGIDVVRALALGATAVGIGRPVLWGLAAAGQDGVREVLELLRTELDEAMALCGARSPGELGPDVLAPHLSAPTGGTA
ncbi:alpha-hydroxy-acid oxidizing protein [Kineosporia sp. J2-2]|uniref:Alpha-hydroxy-acid oxidizing protein n=1 Tax=Kineosporia corallincola TaxID=2835133 RepID=A0ABS5TSW1_9ACTN|nr:alpha-hydroxy acid oxidase [Kineosporia corallincola]MBT0773871.1 alpha-hydroxy-acid oxidizing protein [Kineosporia corallincola]